MPAFRPCARGRNAVVPSSMSEQHTFMWRGEKVLAIPTGVTWYLYRHGEVLSGPVVKPGELWFQAEQRLRTWMDANVQSRHH